MARSSAHCVEAPTREAARRERSARSALRSSNIVAPTLSTHRRSRGATSRSSWPSSASRYFGGTRRTSPSAWAHSLAWAARLVVPGSGARRRTASSRRGSRRALSVTRERRRIGQFGCRLGQVLSQHRSERREVTAPTRSEPSNLTRNHEWVQTTADAKLVAAEDLQHATFGEVAWSQGSSLNSHWALSLSGKKKGAEDHVQGAHLLLMCRCVKLSAGRGRPPAPKPARRDSWTGSAPTPLALGGESRERRSPALGPSRQCR